MRLIDLGLGQAPDSSGYDELEEFDGELANWVRRGVPTAAEPGSEPAPIPPAERSGTAGDTPVVRRDAIVTWITSHRDKLESQRDGFRLVENTTLTAPRGWEVADLMIRSAEDLVAVLGRAQLEGALDDDVFGD